MNEPVSPRTLQRMPVYLHYLQSLPETEGYTSAKAIAEALGLTEIQVRKDLAAVSGRGKPKVGYEVAALLRDVETFLGCDEANHAVLVGAGKLGRALMGYDGFRRYGLHIVAAFDGDPAALGMDASGKPVLPMEELGAFCARRRIRIGVITVPAAAAQGVCDRLTESGVLAIWNFAPAHLSAPDSVLIRSENMAASLAILSRHLRETIQKESRGGGEK